MTDLTETEYRTLRTRTLAILGELGAADNGTATAIAAHLVPTVEAILRQRVAEALDRAAVEIESRRDYSSETLMEFEDGFSEGFAESARIVREGIA